MGWFKSPSFGLQWCCSQWDFKLAVCCWHLFVVSFVCVSSMTWYCLPGQALLALLVGKKVGAQMGMTLKSNIRHNPTWVVNCPETYFWWNAKENTNKWIFLERYVGQYSLQNEVSMKLEVCVAACPHSKQHLTLIMFICVMYVTYFSC